MPDLNDNRKYSLWLALWAFLCLGFSFLYGANASMGDHAVYITIAQGIDSGGILYKNIIDVKNIGFLLTFSSLYKIYTFFSPTLFYFFQYENIVLFFLYYIIALLSYHISKNYTSKKTAFLISGFNLVFFAPDIYTYFLNQPQVAILYLYLYLLFVLKTFHTQKLSLYYGYGLMLGICYATASPYIFMTLTVPYLAWISSQNKISVCIKKCLFGFLGFITIQAAIIFFYTFHNTVRDLLYWTILFPLTDHNPEPLAEKIVLTIKHMLWAKSYPYFNRTQFIYNIFIILQYLLYSCIIFRIVSKPLFFTSREKFIAVVGGLSIFSRLLLMRPFSSYNFYLTPLLFLSIPLILKIIPKKNLIVCYIIIGATFFMQAQYNVWKTPRYSHLYNLQFEKFIQNNPDKRPTYIAAGQWHFSYSTKWKLLYYNFYEEKDNTLQKLIYSLKPECLLGINEKRKTDVYFDKFIQDEYTPISKIDNLYIHKDKVSSWRQEFQ